MSEERKQVLTMLAEGKITPDEAERLLEKLGESADGGRDHGGHRRHGRRLKHLRIGSHALPEGETTGGSNDDAEDAKRPVKDLRVEIRSEDGDQVSVRVPLGLIRTGIKLTTLLPSDTNAKLADKGIDLSELGELEGQELVDALRELKVDVDSADGDTVRVFCE